MSSLPEHLLDIDKVRHP